MTLEKYPALNLENEKISSRFYHVKVLSKVLYCVELLVLEVQLHAFLTWALDGGQPLASHCGCFSVRQAAVCGGLGGCLSHPRSSGKVKNCISTQNHNPVISHTLVSVQSYSDC
jgi:hypothetical protein